VESVPGCMSVLGGVCAYECLLLVLSSPSLPRLLRNMEQCVMWHPLAQQECHPGGGGGGGVGGGGGGGVSNCGGHLTP